MDNKNKTFVDKFSVISFDSINNNDKFYKDIDYYLESYLMSNTFVISRDLVHQFLWKEIYINNVDKDKLYKKITNKLAIKLNIKMKQIKRDVLKSSRKRSFLLNDLNILLDNLIDKLSSLRDHFILIDNDKQLLFSSDNNNVIKYCWGDSKLICLFVKKICNFISDPNITKIIKIFVNNEDNLRSLIIFYKKIKKFNYYYNQCELWFLELVKQVITSNINLEIHIILRKLNGNIITNNIYTLNNLYNYYIKTSNKFKFLNDSSIFNGILLKMNDEFSIICKDISKNKLESNFINEFLDQFKDIISLLLDFDDKILYKLILFMELYDIHTIDGLGNLINFYKNIIDILQMKNLEYISKKYINYGKSIFLFEEKFSDMMNKCVSINNENETNILINVCNIINDKINNIKNVSRLKSDLRICLSFLSKINSKDKFIRIYEKNLTIRIMNNYSKNQIELEEKLIDNVLVSHYKISELNKIVKIINDCKNSKLLNNDYVNLISSSSMKYNQNLIDKVKELTCITTSYNNWNINVLEGYIIIEKFIKSEYVNYLLESDYDFDNYFAVMYKYNNYYEKKYSDKRSLVWYPHLGLLNLDFTCFDNTICNIKMLPIQNMMINYICYDNNYDNIIDYFQSISSYSKEYLENVLKSVINSGIFKLADQLPQFIIANKNFSNEKCDMIELLDNFVNQNVIWDSSREKQLVYDRKLILTSIVNSLLKKGSNEGYSLDEIMTLCSKEQNIFKITKKLLKDSLLFMKENDYIKINDDIDSESSMITKINFF